MEQFRSHVLVCTGGGCIASGALAVSAAFSEELEAHGLADEVQIVETGCLGPCAVGPVALVYPDGVFYQNIKVPDVAEIVEEHLLKGRVVPRLVSHAPGTEKSIAEMRDVEFFNADVVIATDQRTGHPADLAYVQAIKSATSLPVLVGSGATSENIREILGIANDRDANAEALGDRPLGNAFGRVVSSLCVDVGAQRF